MIIFLYGTDTFRSSQKLRELKEKYLQDIDPTANSIIYIEGQNFNLSDFKNSTSNSSLFSSKKLYIIKNIFSTKNKSFIDELIFILKKDSNSDNIFIFIDEADESSLIKNKLFNFLSTQQFVQNFKQLTEKQTVKWINGKMKKLDGNITEAAALKLAAVTDNNLWQIDNELNKLFFLKNKNTINDADINENVVGVTTGSIFSFIDAIAAKNKKVAIELMEREIESGQSESFLLAMITRQFKILLQIKDDSCENLNNKQIAQKLKLHPFVVQKSSFQAKNFSLPALKNIFSRLTMLDADFKSGKADLKTFLELLIIKI